MVDGSGRGVRMGPTAGFEVMPDLAPADFSDDGRYRWQLTREVMGSLFVRPYKPILFCGYNPSKAGVIANDPTVRREIGFTRQFQGTTLIKVNLFAGVATDPFDLDAFDDPVGVENDEWIWESIKHVLESNGLLIAAWGIPKGSRSVRDEFLKRSKEVLEMSESWMCFSRTKGGYPSHPLYLANNSTLKPYNPEALR